VKKNSTTYTLLLKSSFEINKLSWFKKVNSGTRFASPFRLMYARGFAERDLPSWTTVSFCRRSIILGMNKIPKITTTKKRPMDLNLGITTVYLLVL
jgi:hypothetical protein